MRWIFLMICLFSLIGCSSTSNPEAAAINARLGLVYLSQQNPVLAKEKLLLALAENPSDANVNLAFAYFLEKTGEPQRAAPYYLKAIKLTVCKGGAFHSYGSYLYRQGRYQEALSYFLLATQDISYLYVAQAYKNAAYCAQKMQNPVLAQKYFHMASYGSSLRCSDSP